MKSTSKKKLIYRLFFFCLFIGIIAGVSLSYKYFIHDKIPDSIYLRENKTTTLNFNIPMIGKTLSKEVDMNKPVTFIANEPGTYKMNLKLFGILNVRTVDVNVLEDGNVYPCGFQIGMYLKADGVFVVDVGEFNGQNGILKKPCLDKLYKGDYIKSLNGKAINNKNELMEQVADSNGNELTFSVIRDEKTVDITIKPELDESGAYKIGLWIKDDTQGIGTMTYINSQNQFAALGHGISDGQTSNLLKTDYGVLYNSTILSIVKGKNGDPGELLGTIEYRDTNIIGKIDKNTSEGIYGTLNKDLISRYKIEPMDVGYSYEVQTGKAYIRMYYQQRFQDYEIEIIKLNNNKEKNMTFKVVSPELLDLTNGIVQGMSGSPIIQNEKLIGAVTHVFVDDSHSGYGIYIEKMIQN